MQQRFYNNIYDFVLKKKKKKKAPPPPPPPQPEITFYMCDALWVMKREMTQLSVERLLYCLFPFRLHQVSIKIDKWAWGRPIIMKKNDGSLTASKVCVLVFCWFVLFVCLGWMGG